ncbi:MAG: hypothetical protein WAO95_07070 [Burkholderiales bacterium]
MTLAVRVPLLVAGMLSLVAGIAAGLARLGFDLAAPAALHGPLVGGAFLGTVIGLERAVALGRWWAYGAPLAAALAGLAWILRLPPQLGGALLAAGGLVLVAAAVAIWRKQRETHNLVLGAGAVCLAVGGGVCAAGHISETAPAWLGFLVLTIAGERLELSRFMPPSPAAKQWFAGICAVLFLAVLLAIPVPQYGWKAVAASLLALAAWLAMQDIARRTIREQGLTRYIAAALLLGYLWLAVGAVIAAAAPDFAPGRPAWDAALHAWFLGFVFSMIFGHAPIIAPALLRVNLRYSAWFYLPLAVLHLSLAERIAGDFLLDHATRARGAAANAVAIVLFIATMLYAGLSKRRP